VGSGIASVLSSAISDGCLLALISVGFVLIFRATRVASFAQGAFALAGVLIFRDLIGIGTGIIAGIAIATICVALVGLLAVFAPLRRTIGAQPLVPAMATIGIATALQEIFILIWGDEPLSFSHQLISFHMHRFLGLSFTSVQIFGGVLALAVCIFTLATMQWTKMGLRMRALADQPMLASYLGIRTTWLAGFAWAIGAGVASIAGIAYAVGNQPTAGDLFGLGLSAFPAILLGGLDSIIGAIVGSFLIALVQDAVVYNLGGQWQDVSAYSILLIVLLVRPAGLFGRESVGRL
jgi:branched-chain amino acid transport system permease protein